MKKNKIVHAVRIYCFWWKRKVIFFFDESKIYIITFFIQGAEQVARCKNKMKIFW